MMDDPDKQVAISFSEGVISLTCSGWPSLGCEVIDPTECSFYQTNLREECCTPVAPPAGPTPAVPTITTIPTSDPTSEPTPEQSAELCTEYVIDFETAAEGGALEGGQWVENEWSELRLTLSESEWPGIPCLLDSSEDGISNTALGSTNDGSWSRRWRRARIGMRELLATRKHSNPSRWK